MIKVRCVLQVMIFLLSLSVSFVYACEPPKEAPYPPLLVEGGMIVFDSVAVLEDEGKSDPEMGLRVSFLNCSTGVIQFISRLPFIADTGNVQDAFLKDIRGGDYLFVIHSAPIRAFTGVRHGSDYFSVLVFQRTGSGFVFDKKLTDYFGSGADTLSQDVDDDKIIYSYPYKNRDAVIEKVESKSFNSWLSGDLVEFTVKQKTSIYSSGNMVDDTKMYLISGDKVKVEAISAGWVSMLYTTTKGKKIRGWVLCNNLNGC